MNQISLSPDYRKLGADYFNVDITLIERSFPHVKDCFIDLRAQITASTGSLLNNYMQVSLSPTIYNFNFGCHMANHLAHMYNKQCEFTM